MHPREGRARSRSPLISTKRTCKRMPLMLRWVSPLSHNQSKRIKKPKTCKSKVKATDRMSSKNLRSMSKKKQQVFIKIAKLSQQRMTNHHQWQVAVELMTKTLISIYQNQIYLQFKKIKCLLGQITNNKTVV